MRLRAKVRRLEQRLKQDKLELLLDNGESVLLHEHDLLTLYGCFIEATPVATENGLYYSQGVKLPKEVDWILKVRPGQEKLIDMFSSTFKNYNEATGGELIE